MSCCYRTYQNQPCFGGLRDGVTGCTADTHGHLMAPADSRRGLPAERLPICAEHWMMRRSDLRAPYHFEPARGAA